MQSTQLEVWGGVGQGGGWGQCGVGVGYCRDDSCLMGRRGCGWDVSCLLVVLDFNMIGC